MAYEIGARNQKPIGSKENAKRTPASAATT
jgi:hypothetical protein